MSVCCVACLNKSASLRSRLSKWISTVCACLMCWILPNRYVERSSRSLLIVIASRQHVAGSNVSWTEWLRVGKQRHLVSKSRLAHTMLDITRGSCSNGDLNCNSAGWNDDISGLDIISAMTSTDRDESRRHDRQAVLVWSVHTSFNNGTCITSYQSHWHIYNIIVLRCSIEFYSIQFEYKITDDINEWSYNLAIQQSISRSVDDQSQWKDHCKANHS